MTTDQKKTLGQLLKESFALFSGNIVKLAFVTLAVFLPLEALILLVFQQLDIGQAVNLKYLSQNQLLGYIFVNLASTIVLFLYQIALFKTIESADKNEGLALQQSYKCAFALFGSYLVVTSLVILKVLLWSLLLLIPGMIFGIFYSFANLALIIDGKKGTQALIYSKHMVKPAVWKFVGNVLALVLIMIPLNFFIAFAVAMIFGQNDANYFELMPAIGGAITSIVIAITGSYASVFFYSLYKELKVRTESI